MSHLDSSSIVCESDSFSHSLRYHQSFWRHPFCIIFLPEFYFIRFSYIKQTCFFSSFSLEIILFTIHGDFPFIISRCSPDDLYERRFTSKKSLLISIEDSYLAYLWEIKSFSQEIHSYDDIYFSESEIFEYFQSLKSIYFTMEILYFDTIFYKIISQFLTTSFRKSCYEHSFSFTGYICDIIHDIIYHKLHRFEDYFWIEEPSRTYELRNNPIAFTHFPIISLSWIKAIKVFRVFR